MQILEDVISQETSEFRILSCAKCASIAWGACGLSGLQTLLGHQGIFVCLNIQ